MIEGYIGRPGSGKSYTLTERAVQLAERGRQVFANYPINYKNCWTFTPEQLLDLPPGVIVIDEAHLWFPARKALNLPASWLAMLSQTRKNGWDLLWCAQHESRVDRVIRDITSWQWLCTAWLSQDDHPMFFRSISYEPEFFRRPDKRQTTVWRKFSPKVARAYDTFERIATAAHLNNENDAYADSSVSERRRRQVTAERAAAQRAAAARAASAGGVDLGRAA